MVQEEVTTEDMAEGRSDTANTHTTWTSLPETRSRINASTAPTTSDNVHSLSASSLTKPSTWMSALNQRTLEFALQFLCEHIRRLSPEQGIHSSIESFGACVPVRETMSVALETACFSDAGSASRPQTHSSGRLMQHRSSRRSSRSAHLEI